LSLVQVQQGELKTCKLRCLQVFFFFTVYFLKIEEI
jgi:hypothetical protein